jgi:hypothetical protein
MYIKLTRETQCITTRTTMQCILLLLYEYYISHLFAISFWRTLQCKLGFIVRRGIHIYYIILLWYCLNINPASSFVVGQRIAIHTHIYIYTYQIYLYIIAVYVLRQRLGGGGNAFCRSGLLRLGDDSTYIQYVYYIMRADACIYRSGACSIILYGEAIVWGQIIHIPVN